MTAPAALVERVAEKMREMLQDDEVDPRTYARAALAAIHAAGYRIVPMELTEKMLSATESGHDDDWFRTLWADWLAAAPSWKEL